MKLEISYKNSLIGSLSAGESLALHLNGSKLTEDLIVRAVGDAVIPEVTKLSAPTIEITDSTLNIYDEKGLATSYDILVDGEVVATVEKVSLISFTINGTLYQAENGMTWGEWQASTYNTVGVDENFLLNGMFIVPSDSSYFVTSTDAIVSDQAYETTANAGGGGVV